MNGRAIRGGGFTRDGEMVLRREEKQKVLAKLMKRQVTKKR